MGNSSATTVPLNTNDADQTASGGCVLIVDDLPANTRLMSGILKISGYDVMTASNGPDALAMLHGEAEVPCTPDVVLLDVMMPGMDGFEVCRRIRAHPDTAFLPVVMVTALQEASDRISALEAGADDFLAKPVDDVEVVARVKSLVRIKRQREELERAYNEVTHAEALRDNLAAMLVHDLRTPLTTIISPLEMLLAGHLGPVDPVQEEIVGICMRSANRLLGLVNELLDVHKMESGEMDLECRPVPPASLVENAIEQISPTRLDAGLKVEQNVDPTLPAIYVDSDLITRVLINLLGNAVKFTPQNGDISIDVQIHDAGSEEPSMLFAITDTGPGVPLEDQERIFTKFGQLETHKTQRAISTGLGLTFCKLAVEAHGGRIWVESEGNHGSSFRFVVPIKAIGS